MAGLSVLVPATEEMLDAEAYLDANPDVRAAGVSARMHFLSHGRHEGRKQFSPEFLDPNYRARKFGLFRDVLEINSDLLAKGVFPITTSDEHFDLAQYMGESANPGFPLFDHEIASHPSRLYMDIGCGFRSVVYENCLYLEVYPSKTADMIVEPTCLYPIKSGSLDGIGCFAVLEHTRKPWLVVQEINRMLRPGGKAYIDWPFLQPVHGFPSHYFNATREGLCSLFQDTGFSIEACDTGAHESPAYTVHWIVSGLLQRLPDGALKDEFSEMRVRDLADLGPTSTIWSKIVAALPTSAVSEFACGNWLLAVKR